VGAREGSQDGGRVTDDLETITKQAECPRVDAARQRDGKREDARCVLRVVFMIARIARAIVEATSALCHTHSALWLVGRISRVRLQACYGDPPA
jgi:hypothetical protein